MGLDFGFNVLGDFANVYNNERNLKYQQSNLDYQKALQKDIFAREDTAVQRKVSDLEKAGMNKYLAAGQGAAAGSVVSTTAPQSNLQLSSGSAKVDVLDAILAKNQIKQAKAQTKQAESEASIASDNAYLSSLRREQGKDIVNYEKLERNVASFLSSYKLENAQRENVLNGILNDWKLADESVYANGKKPNWLRMIESPIDLKEAQYNFYEQLKEKTHFEGVKSQKEADNWSFLKFLDLLYKGLSLF